MKTSNKVTALYLFDGLELHKNTSIKYDIKNKNLISLDLSQNTDHHLGNGVIMPGFMDLQINGCGGICFNNEISMNGLEIMYQTCRENGTLFFLPTMITCAWKEMILALEVVKEWFADYSFNRGVIGIHLEGPFLNKKKAGTHQLEFIIPPEDHYLEQIVAYRKYFPIKLTIAIEQFSHTQLSYLASNGIILSIGHSNTSAHQVEESFKYGLKTATHLYNAMSCSTGRESGVVGGILNTDSLYTGFIPDMVHLSKENIRLIAKTKQSKAYIVTDAINPAGTNLKENFMFSGKELSVINGSCVDKNGILGGSIITMREGVKNCFIDCAIELSSALGMASFNPAKLMQLTNLAIIDYKTNLNNLIYFNLNDFTATPLSLFI